jgi:hypothetical protein
MSLIRRGGSVVETYLPSKRSQLGDDQTSSMASGKRRGRLTYALALELRGSAVADHATVSFQNLVLIRQRVLDGVILFHGAAQRSHSLFSDRSGLPCWPHPPGK